MTSRVSPLKKKKLSPGMILLFAFFAWFILACLILPNLNLSRQVFFGDG